MATYKLIQDIEAEDKILGPLTLRQFLFALGTVFLGYISFLFYLHHVVFLLLVTIPPMVFTMFFAFPFGRDQPTEVWALGKLRYWFKPRKRIWDQSGVKELVTITVPKKIEHVFTDGLSQREVQSRLNALANTIDSRGWAVKNVNLNMYTASPLAITSSDRLLDISSIPQEVPDEQVFASDDILDERNNPIAQQFDTMIAQSSQNHRQQIVNQINSPAAPVPEATPEPWFMGGAPSATAVTATDEEAALVARSRAQLDAQQVTYGNLRTIQPLGSQPAAQPAPIDPAIPSVSATRLATPADPIPDDWKLPDEIVEPPPLTPLPSVTPTPDPAILSLATNNDLNVATLAREAEKAKQSESGDDEVVISLR